MIYSCYRIIHMIFLPMRMMLVEDFHDLIMVLNDRLIENLFKISRFVFDFQLLHSEKFHHHILVFDGDILLFENLLNHGKH